MRSLRLAAAAIGLSALGLAAVPAAGAMADQNPPSASTCPAGSVAAYTEPAAYLYELDNGLTGFTPEQFQAFWASVDHNGDGLLCLMKSPNGTATGHAPGENNWTDNSARGQAN